MRVSKFGMFLGMAYVLPTILCVGMGYSSEDSKSNYVLLQLPIALQMSGLHAMGLLETLSSLSWVGLYFLLCLPLIVVLYGLGWGSSNLVRRWMKQADKPSR